MKDSENAFAVNSSPTFEGYFYQGSDDYFDYFESRWNFETDKKFKINKDYFLTKQRLDKNSNKELKIDVIKTPKIFGIIKQDTLYISKNL
ncbi:hypothetical protein [Epilithonimonas tenax]|uniref:hypothetical protein n=1 Tax=Epilithonimonas tenax TaxID=191577 RepID=UPI000422FA9C|nr:hypothetical protein [Epilithonimonas tenax]